MASESQVNSTPFLSQGHMIPLIDIAKTLARCSAIVNVITTPAIAAPITIDPAIRSGLAIRVPKSHSFSS
uniref:Uncharacterized protein n=1 Tax=Rhizophora mucronata TaxID=61149 RepID=A0A2P2P9V4_RHIMU